MYSKINKNDLSPKDLEENQNDNGMDDRSKENELRMSSIIDGGDNFISTISTIFEVFMLVMNWIMKNAYLIAVLIIAILFVFKLQS